MSRSIFLSHSSRFSHSCHLNRTQHALLYHSHYNISMSERFQNWRRKSEEKSNVQAWLGESRRFLEYQEYTMHSFEAHCKTLVDAHDKAGFWKRQMRALTEWMNPEKANEQNEMIDESRSLCNIIDSFPAEAMDDPEKYFTNSNKAKLALEAKMHTQDIDSVLEKFRNNKMIHKQLKKRVDKGDDLPRSSEELHEGLAKPKSLNETFRTSTAYNKPHNPNKKNELFEKHIIYWNDKVWAGPYRRRKFYRPSPSWRMRDWRQYQPKWKRAEALTTEQEGEHDPVEWANADRYAREKFVKDKNVRHFHGPNDDSVWDDLVPNLNYYNTNKPTQKVRAKSYS